MTIGRRNGAVKRFVVAVGVLVAVGWAVRVGTQQVVSCRTLGTQPIHRTFDDVPMGAISTTVDAVTFAGFMTECGGSFFCPDDPVTRADQTVPLRSRRST